MKILELFPQELLHWMERKSELLFVGIFPHDDGGEGYNGGCCQIAVEMENVKCDRDG